MESQRSIKTFTPHTVALLLFILVGTAAMIYRLAKGLGYPVTRLNDTVPWGFWLGFDVLGGVAMAAGGFIIACAVYLFNWKKYKPITRPAILTAFLGYLMAIVALFLDIGHPFRLWHPGVMWQVHSVMWVVAMHVIFYTTTLAIESSPMLFERLRWDRARKAVEKILIGAVIFGVMLSTLHQSSLGAVFLISKAKMSPLWFDTALPYHFLVSSIAMGLAMVSLESYFSSRAFDHKIDREIFFGLARGVLITLILYLLLKLYHLIRNGGFGMAFNGSLEANMYLVEMLVGVILPICLLAAESVRTDVRRIVGVNVLVVAGVLLNRLNVGIFSMNRYITDQGAGYFPSLLEFLVTLGIVSLGVFLFKMAAKHLPLFVHEAHPSCADSGK